jgi:excisionase family DNA binding protein
LLASTPEKLGYSVAETAIASDLSVPTIYRLIKSGRLSSVRIGGRRIIHRDEIQRLLKPAIENPQAA